ncbi:MAG: ATP-binding cassette domain-containing protein, partial [Acidimicrobiia bacterium]|nr:ATP-binding cassette domain-containing protein [Acidimicrobiia bacterium]
MSALQLRDVRKVYRSGDEDVVALDHATLDVDDDEIVALVGPSGSGKTTLLSIGGGLLTPTEGSVRVRGTEISGFGQKELTRFRGANVGFVFQSVNLVPFLNAAENLMVVADMNGQPRGPARARATQLLDELG